MPERNKQTIYPYMPNTVPAVRKEMLDAVGVSDVSELFEGIPAEIRFGDKDMPLPEPVLTEQELHKYVAGMLKKNKDCEEYTSFLGGGVAQHFVPAICDEIVRKPEFYTTFMGFNYSATGCIQAWWEFQSMLCDLLEMELTGWVAQDGTTSCWSAIILAARVNGRKEVVIPGNIDPQRLGIIQEVCRAKLDIKVAKFDEKTGLVDIDDLKSKISDKTACVFFENPTYLGSIEDRGQEISDYAHEHGAYVVVYVNPISLGLLETPKNYGADIICGEIQSLGVHLQYGGGMAGFVATPYEEKWMVNYPYLSFSRFKTSIPNRFYYGPTNFGSVSYDLREEADDVTSTNSALWEIPAAVYLSIMGPEGMREVGETIISRSNYAKARLREVKGVTLPTDGTASFMEFVVNFDGTGKTVKEINKALLDYKIFGGHDLSEEFPQYGQSALYCVTENIDKEQIDALVSALQEVVR